MLWILEGDMMKILVIALLLTLVGVASHAQLNGHFGDMDANKDKKVTADEFAAFFPNSKPDDFKKADANGDGGITHDEWHDYKEKNSLGHVDGKDHDDKNAKPGQPKS